MVGDELAGPGQSHAVDAVRLEDVDGEVGTDADYHQRHEQLVASGEFGDEENTGQRGVHDACHDACHAHQGEVLLGDVKSDLIHIPYTGEEKAGEAADEEAGGERSATAAGTVRGRSGEDFGDEDKPDV